jgi:hypothetical protein
MRRDLLRSAGFAETAIVRLRQPTARVARAARRFVRRGAADTLPPSARHGIEGSRRIVKVVILAGGLGTRLSEETASRPKPMVEIGERPILWHIMKTYSHYGLSDFVICLGYKGYVIKEYFSNYSLHMSDVTFDLRDNSTVVHQNAAEPWRVTLVDTGAETQTGDRIKRVSEHIGDETFFLAYGDGGPTWTSRSCSTSIECTGSRRRSPPSSRSDASGRSRSTRAKSWEGSWRRASAPPRRSRSAMAPG